MKRKFIVGLGLVTCVFIVSGVFIIRSLSELRLVTELKDRQQKMVTSYDRMLYFISNDQSELYAAEAGYRKDLGLLRGNVQQTTKLLSSLRDGYAAYLSRTTCKYCHSNGKTAGSAGTLERVHHHEETLRNIHEKISGYEEKIARIIESGGAEAARPLVKAAERDSEEIEDLIRKVRNSMDEMNRSLEKMELTTVGRSTNSIVFAIAVGILFSAVIVIVMIRSITGPVNMLVHGIEKVSVGDYHSKVAIASHDEIGFLAESFNKMTDNLDKITQQKEMLMKELRELNSNLEQRVDEATVELRMTHEIMLRNETLSIAGTFASGVAHELATPISSVISYFQQVKERIRDRDTLAEDIDLIEKELQRCRNILRGMLDFARAPEEEKVLTDINSIIRNLLALVKYQSEYKKSMTIKEDLDPGIPGIMAVPGQLRQVFLNIIMNALQSMPEGGELSVSTSASGDGKRITITISDTGYGIPKDEINRIFQPFYTTKKTGTGLGLSISYGIIKGHGGEIEVKSEQGKGTTFVVCFPVSSDIGRADTTITEHKE